MVHLPTSSRRAVRERGGVETPLLAGSMPIMHIYVDCCCCPSPGARASFDGRHTMRIPRDSSIACRTPDHLAACHLMDLQGELRRAAHDAHAARLLHRLPHLHLRAAHGQHAPAGRGLASQTWQGTAAWHVVSACSCRCRRGVTDSSLAHVGAPCLQVRGHHPEASLDGVAAQPGRLPARHAVAMRGNWQQQGGGIQRAVARLWR